jgi:hypothetical protein
LKEKATVAENVKKKKKKVMTKLKLSGENGNKDLIFFVDGLKIM